MIDIVIVHRESTPVDIARALGPSEEPPEMPFHCVSRDELQFQIETVSMERLSAVRSDPESVAFARNESVILFDPSGDLSRWKETAFVLTEQDIAQRAMRQFFRFQYLTGDYRIEKWTFREAWVPLTQILNEASDCFCGFLHCINGRFIPRNDWLVYLTYELEVKPPDYARLIQGMYEAIASLSAIESRLKNVRVAGSWMTHYCTAKGWIQ